MDSSVVWRATSATEAVVVVVVAEVNCITVVDRPTARRSLRSLAVDTRSVAAAAVAVGLVD